MRILILYNRDPYALKAVNLLIPALAGDHELLLGHSRHVGKDPSTLPGPLQDLSQTEAKLLGELNTDGRGASRSSGALLSTTASDDVALDDITFDDINSPAGLGRLERLAPDLIVSIRFGRILKDAAIAIPRIGVMNLHSGDLPAYRGVMPTFWAMLHGEAAIGTTLHWITDATIDTGPAISRASIPVESQSSYLRQVWALYDVGVPLIVNAVRGIGRESMSASLKSAKRPSAQGNYYSFPDDAAIAAFLERGLRLTSAGDLATLPGLAVREDQRA